MPVMSGFSCHRQSPLSSTPNSLTASSITVASSQRSSKLVRRSAPRVRHATPPRDAPQPHRVPSVDEMAESLKYTGRLSDMLVPLRHLGGTTLQSVSNPPSAPLHRQQASAPGASARQIGMNLQGSGAASESRISTEEVGAAWASRGSTSPRMTPRSPSPSLAPTSFAAASTSFAAASARVRTEAEQALRSSLRVASAAPSPGAWDGAHALAGTTDTRPSELHSENGRHPQATVLEADAIYWQQRLETHRVSKYALSSEAHLIAATSALIAGASSQERSGAERLVSACNQQECGASESPRVHIHSDHERSEAPWEQQGSRCEWEQQGSRCDWEQQGSLVSSSLGSSCRPSFRPPLAGPQSGRAPPPSTPAARAAPASQEPLPRAPPAPAFAALLVPPPPLASTPRGGGA